MNKNDATPEQQNKLHELGFHWNEKDCEWFSDEYEDVYRITFDEGLKEYILSQWRWDDDMQEYEEVFDHYKDLKSLLESNF